MDTIVEIDENQRYWVGGGFGTRGLLPTDRGAFSTTDGSMVWKSPAEASEDLVLLGRGWKYEKDEFKAAPQWMYATDFRPESVKNAKPNRGMMHWVRFRRLFRTKQFNPDEFVDRAISEKCTQVDSSATNALHQLLLDTLTYCSLLHNPKAYTDATTLPLKERIITLSIHQPENGNGQTNSDALYHLDQLRIKLEKFIESEQSNTVMNRLFKSVDFPFEKRTGKEAFEIRKAIVSRQCFSEKECSTISNLIVKKVDPQFQLHCNLPNCGKDCKFYRVQCSNHGCPLIMSRMYIDEHDEQCRYKIIECECGERFPRHELAIHNAQACKLRYVECPYKKMGCNVAVRACDLQKHLEEEANTHLMFAVNRMMEYQDVINNLNTRVGKLEKENKTLKHTVDNHVRKSTTDLSELNKKFKKTSKTLADHEATCKKEFIKLSL
mmetsp:Transcript_27440/g.60396  ORF Transcript_27440/g.60396 Transcript_27440/m.60396 type:complete len:437 (-) Transcript_27440:696-2006(-)